MTISQLSLSRAHSGGDTFPLLTSPVTDTLPPSLPAVNGAEARPRQLLSTRGAEDEDLVSRTLWM